MAIEIRETLIVCRHKPDEFRPPNDKSCKFRQKTAYSVRRIPTQCLTTNDPSGTDQLAKKCPGQKKRRPRRRAGASTTTRTSPSRVSLCVYQSAARVS